ncbi:flagellar hook-associated protein FlgL [Kurthia huakuii]|uniref:flagellar hook-associated protein FlgL n=1 Tax=Kurthia huakuii TaxID=1421019 RepID=UPI000496254B|nr:flagellar hook-associated protein FlgL [Kurthia huakuii]MBM7700158.1 flagellar hook-associated protein 3 FlgL [Kurthia huakuii]
MRVTQSMLSSTMLRNLGNSYNKMGQWQEQLSTGSKLLRPSDDPVGVTKAMNYRTQLTQNAQYDINLDTATKWLDTTDTALDSLGKAMTRVQELITQAANDTNQTVDREKMLLEIKQIHEEMKDLANTKVGDDYIFSGTRTNEPAYVDTAVTETGYTDGAGNSVALKESYMQKDGSTVTMYRDGAGVLQATVKTTAATPPVTTVTDGNGNQATGPINIVDENGATVLSIDDVTGNENGTATPGTPTTETKKMPQYLDGMKSAANIEIYNDIVLGVNTTEAKKMFSKLDDVFKQIEQVLTGDVNGATYGEKIGALLGGTNSAADKNYTTIQGSIDLILSNRAEVGAKQNRVDMMSDRLALQKETLTKQKSNVEDVEYEEAITNLITQESIHRASLSVGGRIIQQTLVDFIR